MDARDHDFLAVPAADDADAALRRVFYQRPRVVDTQQLARGAERDRQRVMLHGRFPHKTAISRRARQRRL